MTTPFDEVRFPTNIGFGSTGGPSRQTQVVVMGSGFEARNARWTDSRFAGDVSYGMKSLDDLYAVKVFFEARNARLRGFRFKDHSDYKSCSPLGTVTPTDIQIGVGDGHTVQFQLFKPYTSGGQTWTRTIKKPVAGTVRIATNGTEQHTGWIVDTTTGIVTFESPPGPPSNGVVITAGFEFDVPVRFDTDSVAVNIKDYLSGIIPSIPIIEDKLA